MQKIYSNFEPGDILVLELPFTDLLGRKLRPVAVISSGDLNRLSEDLIVSKISSSTFFPEYEVVIEQDDLAEGKLKKTSYIHCHSLFTVEKSLVFRKVGRLSGKKIDEVRRVLKKVFEV